MLKLRLYLVLVGVRVGLPNPDFFLREERYIDRVQKLLFIFTTNLARWTWLDPGPLLWNSK